MMMTTTTTMGAPMPLQAPGLQRLSLPPAHTHARGGAGGEGAPMQAPGLQRLSPAPAAQARGLQALQHHEPLHCSLLRW